MDHSPFDSRRWIVVGDKAILKGAIESDVRHLFNTFGRQPDPSFRAFAHVWEQTNFDLIHFACPDKNGRNNFMQALYQVVLEYLPAPSLTVRAGVLYMLYLLYFTQPSVWEPIQIHITFSTFRALGQMVQSAASNESLKACGYIFHRMLEEDTFSFSAVEWELDTGSQWGGIENSDEGVERELMKVEKEMLSDNMNGLLDQTMFANLSQLTSSYEEKKRLLLPTPQANVATRRILEAASIPQPEALSNVMMSSPLVKDSRDSVRELGGKLYDYQEAQMRRLKGLPPDSKSQSRPAFEPLASLSSSRPLNERRSQIRQLDFSNRRWQPHYLRDRQHS
ncbi:hypothetical protein BZG36_00860 [Bifiguratus adelaidae]|uniref:Uncharacterized protein n=1 Tax=Bifiguratus adelaidae TaxID=1938954 RepID=A0A261Y5V7_9FUNG|nr:hypothetical protein BZG36_00860 [Bifiguratus adelaidae]